MSADDFKTLREALAQVQYRGTAKQHTERTAALDRIEASAAAMREALERCRLSERPGSDLEAAINAALATDAGAALLAERGHWQRLAERAEAERDEMRAQRADLREELNRAALDLSAARAEIANRDATLAALRDAVERLERTIAPPPGPQLLDDTLAAVHAA